MAPVAAAALFTGVAAAAPPQGLGTAVTIGCLNQGSLASFSAITAQPGPEASPPIGAGEVLFTSAPALGPVPAAGQVTVAWLTAGLFHQLAEFNPECFAGLRRVFAGGDVVSPRHVRTLLELHEGLEFVNGYGPTESTTFTCCHLVRSAGELTGDTVPIGTPIANTDVFVVDEDGTPVPPGVRGELWIAGDGLAAGYAGRPDLTAERFGTIGGVRVYRTGDLVVQRPDGALDFLGRNDFQVKVNGFRIELPEVEAALGALPGVRQACVLAEPDPFGGKRLVAFVVPDEVSGTAPRHLRSGLAAGLPSYMVPARYEFMDRFPLTRNGKVDRDVLLRGQERN